MAKMIDHKTKLASRGYTWGRLGISESAYYKKTKAERLKLNLIEPFYLIQTAIVGMDYHMK